MASGQEIQGDAPDAAKAASDKGVEFGDAFTPPGKSGSDDTEAQKQTETRQGPRFSGIGEEWGVLSWRKRNFQVAGEAITLSEPVAKHLRDSLSQSLKQQTRLTDGSQFNEAQKALLADAEATMKNPRELLTLFTDKANENSPLRRLIESTFSRMGIKIEANPSDGRLSISASRDSLTLNNESEADSLKITMRHNRLGAPSILFEQTQGDKEARIGPRPIGEKPEEKKTTKSLSLEDGRKWLGDQYQSSLDQSTESARIAKERAEAAAREKQALDEAAARRAANADPVIQRSVATAIDQTGFKNIPADTVARTIHNLLNLDQKALESLFKAQSSHSPESVVLKQAVQNMGLRMEMLTDGSALALHRHDSNEAIIVSQDGSAKLAKKLPAANGAVDLNFDAYRYAQAKERNARMADFLEARMLEGKPFVENAVEKLDLERRYARLLVDRDLDQRLAERIATQKINTNSIKNTALDYLVSTSMGRTMETPIALDRLMRPSPEGSARETERLYFESLLRRAGLQVSIAEGQSVQAGGRWLTMSTTTLDGKSFHYSAGGEITVFGAAGKATDATAESTARSFKQTLKSTEHKAAVVEQLNNLLPKLGITELSNEDRKAIETLVDRNSANRSSGFPSYSDRKLKEGLLAQLREKGFQTDISADRAYLIISSPKQEKSLAISLNPDSAGRNFGSNIFLVNPVEKDKTIDIGKSNIDGWVKDSSPESLRSWLIESKFSSEEYARQKARGLESAKIEVMKDRARLEYLVEERLAALLPESLLSAKQPITAERAREIRNYTAKLISSISSISRDGVPDLSPPGNVPWKLVGQEAGSAERQYFESCLKTAGFTGRLIVDKETGRKIEGYRLTETGSLREINIPGSSLGFSSGDYQYEPLSAQDRGSFRETVDSSLKVAELVNNALIRMQENGSTIPARDRLAVLENIRQTILFAQGKSGYDGLARLAGMTAAERALTNSILKRAGIDMYIFNHSSSGFAEGAPLQDISFRFSDPKSGQVQTLELGVEFAPHNPNTIQDLEIRNQGSAAQADALRSSLANALSAFVVEGKPSQNTALDGSSVKGARIEMPSSVDRARINAVVEFAAQSRGLNQPEVERTAASVMRSLLGIEGSGFDSPVPSQQLKSVLFAALENAGYQASLVSSKELGLSGRDGHTLDLYLYKSGNECTVLRYRFDPSGKSIGHPEIFLTQTDSEGRPFTGQLKAATNSDQFTKAVAEGLQSADISAPAGNRSEITETRSRDGKADGQTINIFVQAEAGKKAAAKSAVPRFTDAEFGQALRKRLDSIDVQAKGLSPSQLDDVKTRVQDFMQAVKAASEKGSKAVGNEISSNIPWAQDTAQHKAFIELLKALECDVKVIEETVAHKTRTDTRYARLMVGLPGAQAAVVVDSDPYLAPGADAKAPLALRSKNRMRLLAYDAADFKGNSGLADGARALSASKAGKAFAEFFTRVGGTASTEGSSVEPAANRLRVGKPDASEQTKVMLEREQIDAALQEAERQAGEKASNARTDDERAKAEEERRNLESWKGALADPNLSAQARQTLAERLAVRAAEVGKGVRQPAVLLPIIGSILLSTAAQAQSSTQAPLYRQK